MDNKILINNKVRDRYVAGESLASAIGAEFSDEIKELRDGNSALNNLNNLQVAMAAAGVKTSDTIDKFLDAYTSGGMDANEWLFPAWMETTIKEAMYGQNIMPYVAPLEIVVDSNIVKSASLNLLDENNKKNIKRARIAEGADIPVGKITIGSKAISLWKHGRGIEMTYEALRRIRIDLFQIHMNAIANDLAQQNLESAADVLLNGDGNDNAAAELGTTGTQGKISAEELVDFLMDYSVATNMAPTTLIAAPDVYKQIYHMVYDSSLVQGADNRVSFSMPQMDLSNIVVLRADVAKGSIVVFNSANTLVRYTENGSNIQENQRFIRNQTELMTFTENSGYAINVNGTNRVIKIKAN